MPFLQWLAKTGINYETLNKMYCISIYLVTIERSCLHNCDEQNTTYTSANFANILKLVASWEQSEDNTVLIIHLSSEGLLKEELHLH